MIKNFVFNKELCDIEDLSVLKNGESFVVEISDENCDISNNYKLSNYKKLYILGPSNMLSDVAQQDSFNFINLKWLENIMRYIYC